jgi:hypothetical protein
MATILGPKKEKAMEALGKLPKGEAKAAQSGKEAIFEILARAADDSNFLAQLADTPKKPFLNIMSSVGRKGQRSPAATSKR